MSSKPEVSAEAAPAGYAPIGGGTPTATAPAGAAETSPSGELDSAALEAALPTLTAKLAGLSAALTENERAVLSSIVTSSAMHLEKLQDINAEAEYIYAKPISAAATPEVRNHLLSLPEALGFSE